MWWISTIRHLSIRKTNPPPCRGSVAPYPVLGNAICPFAPHTPVNISFGLLHFGLQIFPLCKVSGYLFIGYSVREGQWVLFREQFLHLWLASAESQPLNFLFLSSEIFENWASSEQSCSCFWVRVAWSLGDSPGAVDRETLPRSIPLSG